MQRNPRVFKPDRRPNRIYELTFPSGDVSAVVGIQLLEEKGESIIVYGYPDGRAHGLRLARVERETKDGIAFSVVPGTAMWDGVHELSVTGDYWMP